MGEKRTIAVTVNGTRYEREVEVRFTLADFIRHARTAERPLLDVLLEAGAIRFKPILLTALAAMIGAAVILADPIFQGLAISLLFGLASSTALTVLVIPAIYVVLRDADRVAK